MVWGFLALKLLGIALGAFVLHAYLVRFERQILGRLALGGHPRWGVMWPLIDAGRALVRPNMIPAGAWRWGYLTAPGATLSATFAALVLVPGGSTISMGGQLVPLWVANPTISLVLVFALQGVAVLGVLLGAWSSGVDELWRMGRATACRAWIAMLPALLSLAGVVMLSGSLNLVAIVRAQRAGLPYLLYQPLGGMVLFLSLLEGSRRLPYQLPGRPEGLLDDFHLQHAGSVLAQYHLAEYLHLLGSSALFATVYLAGWHGPGSSGPHWLVAKTVVVGVGLLWLRQRGRAHPPSRLRCWPMLMLLAVFNTLLTGGILMWRG